MKHFLSLAFCLTISVNSVFCDTTIDSLINKLSLVNDTGKIDILIHLSKAHWTIAPSKGLFFANEASKLAEKYKEPNKKAKALLYGGVNAWFMGSYDEAINYYQKSLTIARAIQDEKLCAFNLNNLGMVNTYLKNYEKAIENYSESSLIMEKTGDNIEYAKIKNNVAELNMLIGNLDEALELHLSVLEIVENSDEQVFLIWLYNDIGIVYQLKDDYKLALQYFNRSLELSNKANNNLGKAKTMNHIGEVYLQQKKYNKAKEYFYYGLNFASEADAKENINESYKNISEYYAAIDDFKKSLEYYKLYKELSDSIINDKKIRTIVKMQARYELESTEKENSLLRKNIEINELTIKKNKTQKVFLIVLLLLTILLIVLINSRLMIRKKKNKELSEKNSLINKQKNQLSSTLIELQGLNEVLYQQKEEIQTSKKELESANKSLAEINATKDRFFSIIAHDLKSPFHAMIGFSDLLADKFEELDSSTQKEYLSIISQSIKNGYKLLENLLTWSRSQMGEVSFEPKKENIYSLSNEEIKILSQSAKNKAIKISNAISADLFTFVDSNMFSTIMRNLISNAIKFTPKGGIVEIKGQLLSNKDNGKHVLISVKDNGTGITPEIKTKLFSISNNTTVQGTEKEVGTGLGLIICNEFIEKHNGKIWVESKVGEGSVFNFTLPYK